MTSPPNNYPSSLLNEYMSDGESASSAQVPEILINFEEAPHETLETSSNCKTPQSGPISAESSMGAPRSRLSTISSVSTMVSSAASCSDMSDDMDLQSVRLKLEKFKHKKKGHSKFNIFNLHRRRQEVVPDPSNEDDGFLAYVIDKLEAQHYRYERNETLRVEWEKAAEVFLFGETLENLFTDDLHLLNFLMDSSFELGEVRFSNLSRYHTDRNYDIKFLLKELQPNLQRFNAVLDLYAQSDLNLEKPELFEVFSSHANHSNGLCIPLAISMFGNWLLSYYKDETSANNYENSLIFDYFRKAARLSLVLKRARRMLEARIDSPDKSALLELNRYLGKDNNNALSTSLHGLGEFYQCMHKSDVAVSLWELNCHLTGDSDSGNLAILGLTDGFGLGNLSKEHKGFGKRSKNHKFNAKRRVAHLYRILMKQPGFDEFGVSWATKDKYN